MNIKFLLLMVFTGYISSDGPYQLTFSTITGEQQSLSPGSGKRILIIPINGVNPDIAQLTFIDSLYKSDTAKYYPVAVPALDFDSSISGDALKTLLFDSLHIGFTVSEPALVKKQAGADQSALFKWLTDVNENKHFDRDVESEGQIFIINEAGTLYSILERGTPDSLFTTALQQNINDPN